MLIGAVRRSMWSGAVDSKALPPLKLHDEYCGQDHCDGGKLAPQSHGMFQLPPRPAKVDADVRAAFAAAGARSGAEQDPLFRAVQLRFLPDVADGTQTPRQARQTAGRCIWLMFGLHLDKRTASGQGTSAMHRNAR